MMSSMRNLKRKGLSRLLFIHKSRKENSRFSWRHEWKMKPHRFSASLLVSLTKRMALSLRCLILRPMRNNFPCWISEKFLSSSLMIPSRSIRIPWRHLWKVAPVRCCYRVGKEKLASMTPTRGRKPPRRLCAVICIRSPTTTNRGDDWARAHSFRFYVHMTSQKIDWKFSHENFTAVNLNFGSRQRTADLFIGLLRFKLFPQH